jgi:hypothetical protein
MFVLDVFRSQYPRTVAFLDGDLKTLATTDSNTWRIFLACSTLSQADATAAVTLTSDSQVPLLWFADLGANCFGYFSYDVPGRIEIGSQVAQHFEADSTNLKAQMFLRVTALHELCNWGTFQKNGQDVGAVEPGLTFQSKLIAAGIITGDGKLAPWWNPPPAPAADAVTAQSRADYLSANMGNASIAVPGLFTGADAGAAMSRGIRNNNPGNVVKGNSAWNGLAEPAVQKTFQRNETVFCVFTEPEWGLRTMAYLLKLYAYKQGLVTARAITAKWAPVSDPSNSPDRYATDVAASLTKLLGVQTGPDDTLTLNADATLIALLKAMAKVENVQFPPYVDLQYRAALLLLPANIV